MTDQFADDEALGTVTLYPLPGVVSVYEFPPATTLMVPELPLCPVALTTVLMGQLCYPLQLPAEAAVATAGRATPGRIAPTAIRAFRSSCLMITPS